MADHPTGPVKLYTTSWCGYCRAALALLTERGIKFENVDLTDDPEELARKKQELGHSTVPIVLIGDQLLGGNSDLQALDKETGLAHLK